MVSNVSGPRYKHSFELASLVAQQLILEMYKAHRVQFFRLCMNMLSGIFSCIIIYFSIRGHALIVFRCKLAVREIDDIKRHVSTECIYLLLWLRKGAWYLTSLSNLYSS